MLKLKKILTSVFILALALGTVSPVLAHNGGDKGSKNGLHLELKGGLGLGNFKHDNKVVVQGQVTAVSSASLPATVSVKVSKSFNKNFTEAQIVTASVNSNTRFAKNPYGKSLFSELAVGDTVLIYGTINSDKTITATALKNNSTVLVKKAATVKAVDPVKQTVTVTKKDQNYTVNVTASTTIATRDGKTLTFADLALGAKIKIIGILNTANKTITAQKIWVKSLL